jgi:murein DD-endopeptidase MepM/ murein hydrolase activator NlpD
MRKVCLLFLFISLCSCSPHTQTHTPTTTASTTAAKSPQPTTTFTLAASDTPIQVTPTPTDAPLRVCSPLEDETFDSLLLIISKHLDIPPFGQDSGHHGVDFAFYQRGERESIQGIEIYATLSGKVVLTLDDRYPYGYAILIETPLSHLPDLLQERLMTNYLPVPEDPGYRLNCPEVTPPTLSGEYSIYHLYAHMEARPTYARGDSIACGEKLGTVGNTGWSSNPHLHLETRLGPSGASFQTMAHYQNDCTAEQMANYCLWRMSGYYQLFDPYMIFDAGEEMSVENE